VEVTTLGANHFVFLSSHFQKKVLKKNENGGSGLSYLSVYLIGVYWLTRGGVSDFRAQILAILTRKTLISPCKIGIWGSENPNFFPPAAGSLPWKYLSMSAPKAENLLFLNL